ncbi:hypothetical protein GGQ18_002979 [Salinibacter ruber]|uniref:hypothetical protein n=1 Tax=Salinibacter ruber TaxID=146919 RepID=UPI0016169B80|nr:hypothetical protein [Salinibacter ruber]MBB4070370.1 hypothetical protein [Salinibacter ruber]
MKGLFYIHSSITEKIAKKIAEEEHQNPIFVEDYRYSSGLKNSIGIEEIYDLRPSDGIISLWKRIKRGDKKLKNLMGNKFHAYAHHVSYKEVQIIISHRMCCGHSIIEEGTDSYLREEKVEKKIEKISRSLKEKIKYMMRIGKKEFFRGDEEAYYATSEKAFPGRENKKIISVNFDSSESEEKETCILVCDSLKYWGKEESTKYIYSIITALNVIKKEYKKVKYKIHPDSYGKWEERLMKMAIHEFGPASKEIDRSESIEDVAIGSGLDVFVYLSSVGLYCGMFSDSSVYSFYRAASKEEGTWALQYVPKVYWDHVQLLSQREV